MVANENARRMRGKVKECERCGRVLSTSNMARHLRGCWVWDPGGVAEPLTGVDQLEEGGRKGRGEGKDTGSVIKVSGDGYGIEVMDENEDGNEKGKDCLFNEDLSSAKS